MDESSLDPRLRDSAEDKSIVVNGDQPLHSHHQHQRQHQHQITSTSTSAPTSISSSSSIPNPVPTTASENIESPYNHASSSTIGPSPGGTGGGGIPLAPPTFTPHTPTASSLAIHDGDTPGYSGPGTTPQDPNDPKRPRACEACRGLKVKCEPDPANPDGPCKRCAKAGRNCIVTQPTRKRQKKTDSRVAELEKKIDALTASLQATRGGGPPQVGNGQQVHPSDDQNGYASLSSYGNASNSWGPPPPRDSHPQYGSQAESSAIASPLGALAGQKRKFSETHTSSDIQGCPPPTQGRTSREDFDPIDKGIITMDQAETLLSRYTQEMAIHLPAVVFPPTMTAAALRKIKPYLFLGVMAASASDMPQIQRQLATDVVHLIADKVVVHGEKSVELIQLFLITVIWYYPPEHFEELKFYQFVHMAAVMAIDIGLGRKRTTAKSRLIPSSWRDHPFRRTSLPDPTTIEARRTWLSAYFLASNVSMALHRTNLIRWNSFMTECMDILESSPEAAPTDRYLCNLVWTHRLAEEVGIQCSMDDPTVVVNIAEPKVQYALRGFERDLAKYGDSIPKEEKRASLLLSFNVLSLYMHEVALHVDKSDDPRPSAITTESLDDPIPGLSESLTAAHIGALSSCLTAIDGIFETFLSMDVRSIRCLPVFNFVRVAYAVVVLIKMYFSASSPDSELGKVINKDNMKVDEYLDRLLDKFRAVAEGDKSRPAAKFQLVLAMLRGWFQKQGNQPSQQKPEGSESVAPKPEGSVPPGDQQQQQQQQQQQSEYNPANTPLQLLSEIATGNDPSRGKQNGGMPTTSMPGYQPFLSSTQPPMYDSNTGTGDVTPNMPGPGQAVMPWLSQGWSDLDYINPGDGFEQAMGLTLQGLGDASAPSGWESSMRFLMGDGTIGGVMEGVSNSNLFQF